MTISVDAYFEERPHDRKKEPRYLAVINKDSCTSCNACATVCPVDCIFEVPSPTPSESYHQIDTSRCIGCQFCYRIPSESTERYTLELCPWNAIDLIHNPNLNGAVSVLQPYYRGHADELPWQKLEEYGYQLRMDGEVYLPRDREDLQRVLEEFREEAWYLDENVRCRIVDDAQPIQNYTRFRATPEGRAVLDAAFQDYERLFLD